MPPCYVLYSTLLQKCSRWCLIKGNRPNGGSDPLRVSTGDSALPIIWRGFYKCKWNYCRWKYRSVNCMKGNFRDYSDSIYIKYRNQAQWELSYTCVSSYWDRIPNLTIYSCRQMQNLWLNQIGCEHFHGSAHLIRISALALIPAELISPQFIGSFTVSVGVSIDEIDKPRVLLAILEFCLRWIINGLVLGVNLWVFGPKIEWSWLLKHFWRESLLLG